MRRTPADDDPDARRRGRRQISPDGVLLFVVFCVLFIAIPLVLFYAHNSEIHFDQYDKDAHKSPEAKGKITGLSEDMIGVAALVVVFGSVCACTLLRDCAAHVVVMLMLVVLVLLPLVLVASGTPYVPDRPLGDDMQPPSSKPPPSPTPERIRNNHRRESWVDYLAILFWLASQTPPCVRCFIGILEWMCAMIECIRQLLCCSFESVCHLCCGLTYTGPGSRGRRVPERQPLIIGPGSRGRRAPERQPLIVRHDGPRPPRDVPQAVRERVETARIAAMEEQRPQPSGRTHYDAISLQGLWEDDVPTPPVLARDQSAYECCVCLEAPKDCVLSPCAHQCMCSTCARRIAAGPPRTRRCPVCRTPIEQIIEIAQVTPSAPPAEIAQVTPSVPPVEITQEAPAEPLSAAELRARAAEQRASEAAARALVTDSDPAETRPITTL